MFNAPSPELQRRHRETLGWRRVTAILQRYCAGAWSFGGRKSMPRPVLLILEGPHDAEFLRRISQTLHLAKASLPDIEHLELIGRLVVLPLGGNGPQPWLARLRTLGKAQLCLFDREMPPVSEFRRIAVAALDDGGSQRAFLTSKRSLENYLHPAAIHEACGVRVSVGDDDPVVENVARRVLHAKGYGNAWPVLSERTRKRLRERAKKLLNRDAASRMTPERLTERDPAGELQLWLRTLGELVA